MKEWIEQPVSPTRICGGCRSLNTIFYTTICPYHFTAPDPNGGPDRQLVVPVMPVIMCAKCHELSISAEGFRAMDQADPLTAAKSLAMHKKK